MQGPSHPVPESDEAFAFLVDLVGRACDASPDVDERGRILLEGLCTLTRTSFGIAAISQGLDQTKTIVVGLRFMYSRISEAAIHQFTQHIEHDVAEDPVHTFVLRALAPGLTLVRRQDVIDNAAWRAHPHYVKRRKGHGTEECLYAGMTYATPNTYLLLSLHRPQEAGPFSDADALIVRTWLRGMGWLVAQFERDKETRDKLDALRPHERTTLAYLQQGLSEKQIAASAKLSQHSVHQYCKRLYRAFSVTSRAELLAACHRMNLRPQVDEPKWRASVKVGLKTGPNAKATPTKDLRAATLKEVKAPQARRAADAKKRAR